MADVICYHTTDAADEILRRGFRDGYGSYGLGSLELVGVWLGDSPMDINEGATGDQVLRIEFGDDINLDEFELIEEHKPYREWCVPASLISDHAAVNVDDRRRSRRDSSLPVGAATTPRKVRP